MAKLSQLLTEEEKQAILNHNKHSVDIDLETEFVDLTVKQLSIIAFPLMRSKYGNIAPASFLPSVACDIIIERSVNNNIPLY